jgi:hypothetical protein
MADVEQAYFNQANFAFPMQQNPLGDGRLDELRKKYKNTRQARNARDLAGTEMSLNERNKVMKRASTRQANAAAGLGAGGQRRGFFRTVKGKKTFVRGGAVITKRTKKGDIVKLVADRGDKGARGLLRQGYRQGIDLAGKNKIGQRVVNTAYQGLSKVVAHPGKAGAIAAGIGAAGVGGAYLMRRMNSNSGDY